MRHENSRVQIPMARACSVPRMKKRSTRGSRVGREKERKASNLAAKVDEAPAVTPPSTKVRKTWWAGDEGENKTSAEAPHPKPASAVPITKARSHPERRQGPALRL
jgi:hypothetical protein